MKRVKMSLVVMGVVTAFGMNFVWAEGKKTTVVDDMMMTAKEEVSPNEGSDSCGLGWQVTKQKTLLGTSTRGTTNAYLSPTWSMTSGTSGCVKHEVAKKDEEAVKYVASNYYPLTAEMAEGQGEYLVGLAHVMGCNENVISNFNQVTQKSFKSIIQNADAYEMLQNVKKELSKEAVLAESCTSVI